MTPASPPPSLAADPRDAFDRLLFDSFPGGSVGPAEFERALPGFEKALRSGVPFDVELLFVRVVEASARAARLVGEGVVAAVRERALAGGFGPEETLAAARFLARVLPAEDDALVRLFTDPALEELQFAMSLDFVLDARDAQEYLALSYLHDADPAAAEALRGFPVPEAARRAWNTFFDASQCIERLRRGWIRRIPFAERAQLAAWVRERAPDFEPEN